MTYFWGVAHGQSVGMTLTSFLRWNAEAIPHKLPALWDALGVENLEAATDRLTQIMENCGMETRLRGVGAGDGDIERILDYIG